jgi:hypothetical protein
LGENKTEVSACTREESALALALADSARVQSAKCTLCQPCLPLKDRLGNVLIMYGFGLIFLLSSQTFKPNLFLMAYIKYAIRQLES